MKYINELEINLPRDKVIELFDNTENLYKWQPDLISFKPINGEPGTEGAQSKLVYKMGKREIEMIETIMKMNPPEEFSATYEAKGVFNEVFNKFEPIEENKTKWIVNNVFKLSGFMKIIGFFMPGSFSKQTCKYMEQFKEFAENN